MWGKLVTPRFWLYFRVFFFVWENKKSWTVCHVDFCVDRKKTHNIRCGINWRCRGKTSKWDRKRATVRRTCLSTCTIHVWDAFCRPREMSVILKMSHIDLPEWLVPLRNAFRKLSFGLKNAKLTTFPSFTSSIFLAGLEHSIHICFSFNFQINVYLFRKLSTHTETDFKASLLVDGFSFSSDQHAHAISFSPFFVCA